MTLLPVKIDQTQFTDGASQTGNCLQACVATLFGVPLNDVPDLRPHSGKPPGQSFLLRQWLRGQGWTLARIAVVQPFDGFYIGCGSVHRIQRVDHAVVMHNGQIYHDPHPSREGLVQLKSVILFYPLCPSLASIPSLQKESLCV